MSIRCSLIWRRLGGWAAVLALAGAGCVSDRFPQDVPVGTPPGVAALGEQISLGGAGATVNAVYRWDGPGTITAVLVPQGAVADGATYPTLTVVRVMWLSRAGFTPLSGTATNAAVRHLVFAGAGDEPATADVEPPSERMGLFTGAGFVGLRGDPAGGVLDLNLREADLRLTDCSAGYSHPLRRTVLTARVQASRDDAAVSRWLKAAGVRATESLGYPMWVRGPRPGAINASPSLLTSSESGADRCDQPAPTPPAGV